MTAVQLLISRSGAADASPVQTRHSWEVGPLAAEAGEVTAAKAVERPQTSA
jgi:hypothetical protein